MESSDSFFDDILSSSGGGEEDEDEQEFTDDPSDPVYRAFSSKYTLEGTIGSFVETALRVLTVVQRGLFGCEAGAGQRGRGQGGCGEDCPAGRDGRGHP